MQKPSGSLTGWPQTFRWYPRGARTEVRTPFYYENPALEKSRFLLLLMRERITVKVKSHLLSKFTFFFFFPQRYFPTFSTERHTLTQRSLPASEGAPGESRRMHAGEEAPRGQQQCRIRHRYDHQTVMLERLPEGRGPRRKPTPEVRSTTVGFLNLSE